MKSPETSTVFAGVDARTDTDLPEWYEARQDTDEVTTFAEAIRELPRATETKVGYENPYTGEWVETERFNAVVEPNRLIDQANADADAETPLFNIPTDSYAIINPTDVYGELEDVLRAETYEDTPLSELVFGEIRQYRGGGEIHMDIMFDGLSVILPGRNDPITMGVTSGYDFFGNNAVYVEGFARDSYCANSIRSLTDREVVKHVGDVDGFGPWWESVLEQLELVADDLLGFITDAQDITLSLPDVPFDLEGFYELLGFPEYLAQQAASDARANAADPFEIDMWTLHSGATYALTHFFRGKEGDALDGYVRTANDILFNPDGTLERVEREYEQQAEAETDGDGQTGLESQVALAQIEQVSDSVREKAETFEEREAELRERFAEAAD
ncbi:hypothetical protein [Natronomonas gomsonensis]|uniref:hypothetical protein n=1 Tax=Natronomonas gomsonensis TaxID=1046043 RepID=UPI0015B7A7D8|nr:hypothetical protein [Natronomonas gomsonensis]